MGIFLSFLNLFSVFYIIMPRFVVDRFFFLSKVYIFFEFGNSLRGYFLVILHKLFVVISKSVFKRIMYKVFLYRTL